MLAKWVGQKQNLMKNSVMIAGVMVNGVWIPRAELEKKLAQ